jgi:hypothetical protein
MCLKMPKPPVPTAEETQMEQEAKIQRESAAVERRRALSEAKESRLESQLYRLGGAGFRSLISGRRGGQGFLRSMLGS